MKRKYGDRPIPEPLLTTGEIARYCHTSVSQVKRWIENNDLSSMQTTGGHYRIRKEDFRSFIERMGFPVIEEFFKKRNSIKVLIADDDETMVEVMADILIDNYENIEVKRTYDGYEALITAGSFKPDFIILDIRMPKINGLDVCRQLRSNKELPSGMKILAMTAHSDVYKRETVLKAGADEYLIKPVDMDVLLKYIDKLF